MKINTRHILKDGYDIKLNRSEEWLVDILNNLFQGDTIDMETVRGHVHLDNLSGNIVLSGRIQFTHHPLCARCGEELTRHEDIALNANFVPLETVSGDDVPTAEEEIELKAEDLDFAFYENEEVEIDPIINDEIALALPYNFYCEVQARCQSKHETLLKEHTVGEIDPRWLGLKSIKIKDKTSS